MALAGLALAGCQDRTVAPSGAVAVAAWLANPAPAFSEVATSPFGVIGGIEHVRIAGRFSGATSLGEFRVPFEIVAPADPDRGNGVVLLEPPHFAFGPAGREVTLGRELLFGRGFAYAAVGFGTNGLNILDPTSDDAMIAGVPVASPGAIDLFGTVDEEILTQFAAALRSSAFARQAVGQVERLYAYGISQTAAALLETLLHPQARGLFDLTLLHLALWRPPFQPPGVFDRSDCEFAPPADAGRVIFIESEGDQLVSDAEDFRRVAGLDGFRIYEVAGAAHAPGPRNPLDHALVARAVFLRGDDWVRRGVAPPADALLERDASGSVDPVYGLPTGIARDADLNARGGVRLPDLELGRARFIAADFSFAPLPGLNGLEGAMVDLACAPRSGSDMVRFRNHGAYVGAFARHARRLVAAGFLLPDDAERLTGEAAESVVGKPGACPAG